MRSKTASRTLLSYLCRARIPSGLVRNVTQQPQRAWYFTHGEFQEHNLAIGDTADASLVGAYALGLFPAMRARGLLRSIENRYIINRGCVGIHACVLLEKVTQPFPRAQALILNPIWIYTLAFGEKCRKFCSSCRC
jgi:hypothetical protein